jgi:hypothetical protein
MFRNGKFEKAHGIEMPKLTSVIRPLTSTPGLCSESYLNLQVPALFITVMFTTALTIRLCFYSKHAEQMRRDGAIRQSDHAVPVDHREDVPCYFVRE